jgi:hypothetical protein
LTLAIGQHEIGRWKASVVVGRYLDTSFRHLRLITIVKRQSEGIAKRGQRPLSGIRLGGFECDIMRELWLRAFMPLGRLTSAL